MIDGINLEAEKDYISVLLTTPEVIVSNAEKVRSELFYDPFHKKIIKKVRALILDNEPIEVSTITSNEKEQKILHDIKERSRIPKSFESFYKILEECLIARELKTAIKTTAGGLTENSNKEVVPSEVLHKLRIELDNLEELRTTSIYTASEIIDSIVTRYLDIHQHAVDGIEYTQDNIVKSPFSEYNKLLKKGGSAGGEMLILAAPTSTGKTEFALNLSSYAAMDLGKNVFVYSLEMEKERLVERILLERSRVDSFRLERGDINDVDIQSLKNAAKAIKQSGLIFEDNLSGDVFDIITSIRKAHYTYGLDMVVIDYLQLIEISVAGRSRNDEVASVSRLLKKECTRLGIPFYVLSQLSRRHMIEGREPILSDLRDSGAIEQDADLVVFLYATDKERKNEVTTKTKVIVAKQRDGSIGYFFTLNHKTIQKFEEISEIEFKKGQRAAPKPEEEDDEIPF